jgi:hypothetical protein
VSVGHGESRAVAACVGTRLAARGSMQSTEQGPVAVTNPAEPSLKDLVITALDDVRELMRTQLEIAKVDATRILRLTAFALVVVTAAGVLLALSVSLALAALVLALKGTAIEALLTAAGGNALISGAAIAWLWLQLRKAKASPESATSEPELLAPSARKEQLS